MDKLNEKSKSVFLYSKDGSKNDVPVKAFEALKSALGDTALTAENFKQFAAGFQEFVNASSIKAAPAADNENPAEAENAENTNNAENANSAETSKNIENAGTTETTQNNVETTSSPEAANVSGAETAAADNTAEQESTQRLKPSSLLSMKA